MVQPCCLARTWRVGSHCPACELPTSAIRIGPFPYWQVLCVANGAYIQQPSRYASELSVAATTGVGHHLRSRVLRARVEAPDDRGRAHARREAAVGSGARPSIPARSSPPGPRRRSAVRSSSRMAAPSTSFRPARDCQVGRARHGGVQPQLRLDQLRAAEECDHEHADRREPEGRHERLERGREPERVLDEDLRDRGEHDRHGDDQQRIVEPDPDRARDIRPEHDERPVPEVDRVRGVAEVLDRAESQQSGR